MTISRIEMIDTKHSLIAAKRKTQIILFFKMILSVIILDFFYHTTSQDTIKIELYCFTDSKQKTKNVFSRKLTCILKTLI